MNENVFRVRFILYVAFLMAMGAQAFVLKIVYRPAAHPVDPTIFYVMAAVAAMLMVLAQTLIRRKISDNAEMLASDPNNKQIVVQGQVFFIFGLAMNEAAYLFGWVCCFLGAPVEQAGTIMGMAFLSQLTMLPHRS